MDPDNRLWLLDLWRGRTASDAWVRPTAHQWGREALASVQGGVQELR